MRAAWGNDTYPNPPFGATLTYYLRAPIPDSDRLVATITDAAGEQVRRLELPPDPGVRRIAWDLRRDPPAPADAAQGGGGRGGRGRQGAMVPTGRYTATLAKLAAGSVIDLGEPQTVLVVPLQR